MSEVKNLYNGDGWWDVSRYWDRLQQIAKQRDSQKLNYKSTKNWSVGNSTHFLGLVAECAFTLETGIMFDKRLNIVGDPGYDFIFEEQKFDIKGTQYFNAPHLKQYPNPKTWVDFYILAGINAPDKQVKVFGYATKEEIQNAKLHNYGYGPQRVIEYQDLHPGLPDVLPSNRKKFGLDAKVIA